MVNPLLHKSHLFHSDVLFVLGFAGGVRPVHFVLTKPNLLNILHRLLNVCTQVVKLLLHLSQLKLLLFHNRLNLFHLQIEQLSILNCGFPVFSLSQ